MTDLKDTKSPDDEIDAGKRSGPLDRREFGKLLAAGVGGLALAMSGCATTGPSPRGRGRVGSDESNPNFPDVIVIGAGLSGLIAARMLLQQGKSVILLEAEDHVGGRMSLEYTANNYALDMGGQWVGPTQRDMQALVDELGISHFTSYECGWSIEQWQGTKHGFNGSVAALLEGQCTMPHMPELPPAACSQFTPCTDRDADMKLMGDVWNELMKIAGTIEPGEPWAAPNAASLDNRTFADWLKEKLSGAKDPARAYTEWLSTFQARIGGSGGFEPKEVSMLHMAWTQKVGAQKEMPEVWLLKGGAGQIPERLKSQILTLAGNLTREPWQNQNRIDKPVRLNEAVTRVLRTQDGFIYVETRSTLDPKVSNSCKSANPPSSTPVIYYCQDVILAIPPPMRAKIDLKSVYKPSAPELQFSQRSKMGSMSKVHLVYESAFWRDLCLSGSVAGSLEGTAGWVGPTYCEFIADSSPPGKIPGILTAFISGDRNKEIESWSRDQVEAQVLKEVCEYFKNKVPDSEVFRRFDPSRPGKKPEFFYRNWNTRPWACGAFTSYLPPDTWFPFGKDGWREPDGAQSKDYGRIFYAGTETSERWPGYYDGAIRAGKRAAAGVLSTRSNRVDPKIFDPLHPDDPHFPRWTEDTTCSPPAGG